MNDLWLKIKIWTKAIIFGLIALYLLLFMFNNRGQTVSLWIWGDRYMVSLLFVIFVTLLVGVLGTILVRTTIRTIRQMRELKERSRSQRLERELADMKSKAAMLHTREEAGRVEPGSTPRTEPAPPRTTRPSEPDET